MIFFANKRRLNNLYNTRVRPTKNEPQQGISYLERARKGVRERQGWVGWTAGCRI
jgi:hypothetical protein